MWKEVKWTQNKISFDGLSLPNHNRIIINIILEYFIRYRKIAMQFNYQKIKYPERPTRQCVGLAFRRSCVRASLAAASLAICASHFYLALCGAQGILPCAEWGSGQSIGSTVSDAIVCSWLWSTTTGSSPLGYLSSIAASC